MPTKVEKDSVTGTETTGHEWDGIKELNTPLPKWWLYIFYACVAWSVVYCFFMPSVPYVTGYFGGIWDYSQRETVEEQLAAARADQAVFLDRMSGLSPDQVAEDPELLTFALAGGAAAFADNCAPCHGLGGAGNPGGYPVLADDDWLWGGTMQDIETTVRHGIRSDLDMNTRLAVMPNFGADGLLDRAQVAAVADYVLSLSRTHPRASAEDMQETAEAAASGDEGAMVEAAAHGAEQMGLASSGPSEETLAMGAEIFAAQCATCHGADATGLHEFGAPNLTDAIWLYGSSRADVIAQINRPRLGVMPAWEERANGGGLDDNTIRMLTVYVHSLGGGE